MSFNKDIYSDIVKQVTDNEDDLAYVCNQMGKLYQDIQRHSSCIDNPRVSKYINDKHDDNYEKALAKGCCGYRDDIIFNSKTGNRFIIGFNYGH